MKTAISIPDNLFEKAELLAQELSFSRSKIFGIAMQEYLERHENQKLLNKLNNAYFDDDQCEEQQLCKKAKHYYSKKINRKAS